MLTRPPISFHRTIFHLVLSIALVLTSVVLVSQLLGKPVKPADAISAPALVGLAAALVALLEYRRRLAFDRSTMAINFMLRFYENSQLSDFRRCLRGRAELPIWAPDGSLREDVVLAMNYFEALAIAVDEACFDLDLVNKMLGMVISELGDHPMSTELRENRFSYEAFYGRLLPRILRLQKRRRGRA